MQGWGTSFLTIFSPFLQCQKKKTHYGPMVGATDWPTDGWTCPMIEMRGLIKKLGKNNLKLKRWRWKNWRPGVDRFRKSPHFSLHMFVQCTSIPVPRPMGPAFRFPARDNSWLSSRGANVRLQGFKDNFLAQFFLLDPKDRHRHRHRHGF